MKYVPGTKGLEKGLRYFINKCLYSGPLNMASPLNTLAKFSDAIEERFEKVQEKYGWEYAIVGTPVKHNNSQAGVAVESKDNKGVIRFYKLYVKKYGDHWLTEATTGPFSMEEWQQEHGGT